MFKNQLPKPKTKREATCQKLANPDHCFATKANQPTCQTQRMFQPQHSPNTNQKKKNKNLNVSH